MVNTLWEEIERDKDGWTREEREKDGWRGIQVEGSEGEKERRRWREIEREAPYV